MTSRQVVARAGIPERIATVAWRPPRPRSGMHADHSLAEALVPTAQRRRPRYLNGALTM